MKALLLLSGGFDSPVAAHLIQQQNVEVIAIHFSYEPFTDDAPEQKSRKLAKKLGIKKLYIIKGGEAFAEIARQTNPRFYYILAKRFMLKYASEYADQEQCQWLITGDNLAQVASQTLTNLTVIDQAATKEVLRPVLCYDKNEIIDLAREIGTYEASEGPEVCDCLGPKNPATSSSLDKIQEEEAKLSFSTLKQKVTTQEVIL